MHAKTIVAADRQDSYGAGGGNMSLELRAALQDITDSTHPIRVLTRIYGLGGKDFFCWRMLLRCFVRDFRLMPGLLITMESHRVRQKIAHSHSIMHPSPKIASRPVSQPALSILQPEKCL